MGISISHPNSRKDNLLFPPEILEKLLENLSTRDKLVARQVCRSWCSHINSTGIDENAVIVFKDSDADLKVLAESPLEIVWSHYCVRNTDLMRSSLSFWSNYGDIVTHLTLYKCSIVPRDDRFYMGCPNLRHLGLQSCDTYFMMGGKFVHVHQLLHLQSLKSLDLTENKYLTDHILFSILFKISQLESLNLSSCPIVFMNSVHNRFYPNNKDSCQPHCEFSDNILSFKMLNLGFLSTPNGSYMKELIFDNTRFDGRALKMISDMDQCNWESLRFNRCLELKPRELIDFLISCQKQIKHLEIERSKISNFDPLSELTNLEHLVLSECSELTSFTFLQKCPNLKYLDISSCSGLKLQADDLKSLRKLRVFKMRGIVPFYFHLSTDNESLSNILCESFATLKNITYLDMGLCGSVVRDELVQVIIKEMRQLKCLDISKTPVTDWGLAGTEIEEFDPRLAPRNMETRRIALLLRLKEKTPGYCMSRLLNLKELNLSSCENLNEATWKLALVLPSLENLNLSNCSQISAMGVLRIIQNCRNLETLNISKCGLHVTGDENLILQMRESLPRLRNLVMM